MYKRQELIEDLRKELVTESGIPHTVLFNEGPGRAGSVLSQSSGKSEVSDWQEKVMIFQKDNLKTLLTTLYKVILNSSENPLEKELQKVKDINELDILFTPGRTMTLEEESEAYNAFSTADQTYLDQGISRHEKLGLAALVDLAPLLNSHLKFKLSKI